jgi:hypothetical protein
MIKQVVFIGILIGLTSSCKKENIFKKDPFVGNYEIHVKEEGADGLTGQYKITYVVMGEVKKSSPDNDPGCDPMNPYFKGSDCDGVNHRYVLSTPNFTYYFTFYEENNSLIGYYNSFTGYYNYYGRGKLYLDGFTYSDYYYAPGGHWQIDIVGIKK